LLREQGITAHGDREGGRQFNAKDFGLIAFGDGVDMPVRE
jgi:hypothetical protein